MSHIEVKGNPGLVRDKTSGAIINSNVRDISGARTRKYLQKQEKERISRLENDIDSIKQDMTDIKSILLKMLEDKNGNN